MNPSLITSRIRRLPSTRTSTSAAVPFVKLCISFLLLVLQIQLSWAAVHVKSLESSQSTRNIAQMGSFHRRWHTSPTRKATPSKANTPHKSRLSSPNQWRAGASVVSSSTTTTWKGFEYYCRVALAGGLAGATGTTVLYPMDSAKTLRQSNPAKFSSVRQALWHLIRLPSTATSAASWQLPQAYRGWLPAALGAIPSSALYFGAYESSKRALEQRFSSKDSSKWWIHGLAAASGNTISSAVFVPKEVLKQQLQYYSEENMHQVLWRILQQKGVRGLYAGYSATLMRNIPSAMVRFVLYEELKRKWSKSQSTVTNGDDHSTSSRLLQMIPAPVALFAAGAVAGAVASGMMTPVDVIKTRLATGTCPVGVQNCFRHVIKEMGWRGLYAGAGSRMMWSGAFSAIGFGTFELSKSFLGVSDY